MPEVWTETKHSSGKVLLLYSLEKPESDYRFISGCFSPDFSTASELYWPELLLWGVHFKERQLR